jgi:Rad52/22 family double-strand break repair protein
MNTALAKVEDNQIEALRQIMTQRTPEQEVRTRPGRGGKPLKYTDGAYVIRTLNEGFGWDWDFVADNEQLIEFNGQPFEVKVRGTLTVRYKGLSVTKTQFGCQPIEMLSNGTKPVSIGDAYKGAATDAMKKCASLLGIALDLYDSDYKPEKYEAEPEPVRNVKLEGVQPTNPGDELRALCHKLGYGDDKLLKWIVYKFGLDGAESLGMALKSMRPEELSQAIDIFRQKVENGGK